MCVVLKISGFKSKCKPRAFLFRKTLPLVEGWDVGCFYFLYYNRFSLRQHLLGNLALISGMAESRLAFRAPGGIFTRVSLAPWWGAFRALGWIFLWARHFFVCSSTQSSLETGPWIFLTLNYHARLGHLWQFILCQTNMNRKKKKLCVCGAKNCKV